MRAKNAKPKEAYKPADGGMYLETTKLARNSDA
jgi:hypothetical protein